MGIGHLLFIVYDGMIYLFLFTKKTIDKDTIYFVISANNTPAKIRPTGTESHVGVNSKTTNNKKPTTGA